MSYALMHNISEARILAWTYDFERVRPITHFTTQERLQEISQEDRLDNDFHHLTGEMVQDI